MKTVIIYGSHHHGNTEKLVKNLAAKYEIDLINAEETTEADLSSYDLIGFASGMDFGKFYVPVTDFEKFVPEGKPLFAMYTCASDSKKYGEQIREMAERKNSQFLGKYGCKGYNTYGPWQIIGGMNKSHPNAKEMNQSEVFFEEIINKVK